MPSPDKLSLAQLREELAFWSFLLPREAVQFLGRNLPLDKLRDSLPAFIGERLRFGLYPARITDALQVVCSREHAAWGQPVNLDPSRPVKYAAAPSVSILIVTYGNLNLTRLCLRSLQESAGATPFEIIVVDNASSDETASYLQQVAASGMLPLRVVCNAENRGFAAANNQAAQLATGETLILLNNDTVVLPGWIEGLTAALSANPSIGMVGPVTNSCGNEAQLGTPYPDLQQMAIFAKAYTDSHVGMRTNPGMLTLFCAALPRQLWLELGGLDEGYGQGMFEDDDLAMAVRARGLQLQLVHDVYVHHYGGAAFNRLPPRHYLRLFWTNRRYFEKKWQTTWQKR